MGKSIGLEQLSRKVYRTIEGLDVEFTQSLGEMEDAWDAIIFGKSGNGKTNFTIVLLKALIKALDCRAEYVSYEEGHGKTMRDAMIYRHNMLEEVGNRLMLTDHLNFEELKRKMSRKQSAKIWVIDSLQASHLSFEQCEQIKRLFVLSRKKKIVIYVSWAEGRNPEGAVAKAVEYYASIKLHVDRLVVFPKSRFGGNKPFMIWKDGARTHRTSKEWQVLQAIMRKKPMITKTKEDEPLNIDNDDMQQETTNEAGSHTGSEHDKQSEAPENGQRQTPEAGILLPNLSGLAPEQHEREGLLPPGESGGQGKVVETLITND